LKTIANQSEANSIKLDHYHIMICTELVPHYHIVSLDFT